MNVFHLPVVALIAGLAVAPLAAVEIAHDDFESGTLSPSLWGDATQVSVSTVRAHQGSRSVKFHFVGDSDLTADAWAELRFDLGAVYPELWVRYQLYIPNNYTHRDAISSDNNKFIRLWGMTYNDYEKVGACTWLNEPANGYSELIADWNYHGDGVGPKGVAKQQFIAASDRGQWIDTMVHVKAATATTFGTIQFWKNGVLVIDGTATMDNYTTGEAHGYRYGYLLGWANSGFTQDTDLFIDDVVFGTTQADVLPVVVAVNHAPVAQAQSVSTAMATAASITLVATDADQDTLSYAIVTAPTHGTLSGNGAIRTYTPATGYSGNDQFTFFANDGAVNSLPATVSITITASSTTGNVTGSSNGTGSSSGDQSENSSGGCGRGGALAMLTMLAMLLSLRCVAGCFKGDRPNAVRLR